LTDGITEAANVDEIPFGTEAALDFIRSQQQSTASELVQGLYMAARTFSGGGPQIDDITSVICRVR
jgi:serine phosphatase RsbU (regulator of sigma subunit)